MKSRFYPKCIYLLTILLLTGCGSQAHVLRKTDVAMGTLVQQTIYVSTEDNKITSDIIDEITKLEQDFLSRRLETSQVYALNQNSGSIQEVTGEMETLLRECLEISEASDGAFDITLGPVIQLWKIDEWAGVNDTAEYSLPTAEEIRQALQLTGYERLELKASQTETQTMAKLQMPEGYVLDMGALGKGLALDHLLELLAQRSQVSGATISLGGSVLTYGSKPDGTPWRVGIVNPLDPQKQLGYLKLTGNLCVSTSGDYERFVEVDGRTYHHIIDPATGYPGESDVKSVTILSESGFLSDALSTACYLLGTEKGMELALEYEAEALFVTHTGEILMSSGMETIFKQNETR